MNPARCFYEGCDTTPSWACDCLNPAVLYCDSHSLVHMRTASGSLIHKVKEIHFGPNSNTQSMLVKKCCELLNGFQKLSKQFTNDFQDLITNLYKRFDENNAKLKDYKDKLKELICQGLNRESYADSDIDPIWFQD